MTKLIDSMVLASFALFTAVMSVLFITTHDIVPASLCTGLCIASCLLTVVRLK